MSEELDGDQELAALQRQLEDAFATTRPRRGFEDELWLRMQQARPATSRWREAIASLGAGLRTVRVPAAALAVIVIVGLTIGVLLQAGPHGGGGASTAGGNFNAGERAPQDFTVAGFGKLPSPSFGTGKALGESGLTPAPATVGGIRYVWAGTATFLATVATVYRYVEPSAAAADRFAAALGTVLRGRPTGFLGSYSASTYTLKVRGTVQSPPSTPAYFIFSSATMPALDVNGVGYDGAATNFLAGHGLTPNWPYTIAVDASGDPIKVVYQRQFTVPGYGPAYLVDSAGSRFGLEVDVSGDRPVLVSGLLPVTLDTAQYNIVSPAQALAPVSGAAPASTPSATLTQVELVYLLVPAGDHSYYEPAYLFKGTMQSQPVRLLVPAVDPSQRTA